MTAKRESPRRAETFKQAADVISGKIEIPEEGMKWIFVSGKKLAVNDSKLEQYLVDTYPCFRTAGVMHWYQDGVYRPDLEGTVSKTLIRMHLPECLQKIYVISSVYNLLLSDERISADTAKINKYPERSILFRNGLYDPIKDEMRPHSPAYMALGGLIPHEYNPGKPVPEAWGTVFETFAAEAFASPEDRLSYLEFIGVSCSRFCGFEKCLLVQGTGSSGKSVAVKTLLHIVGAENHSALSLHQLSEKFFKIQLLGKLLNACTDINSRQIDYSGDIKKIISGERITDSYKGRQNFSFEPFAKHIFSANELPGAGDRSTGLYRRLIILSMNHVPEKPDPDLIRKLTSARSTAYILDKAVKAYAAALRRGRMTESLEAKENVAEYRKSNDSVTAFWEENITATGNSTDRIERDLLFERYRIFCEDEGYVPVAKKNLFKVLREQRGLRDGKSGDTRFFKFVKFS